MLIHIHFSWKNTVTKVLKEHDNLQKKIVEAGIQSKFLVFSLLVFTVIETVSYEQVKNRPNAFLTGVMAPRKLFTYERIARQLYETSFLHLLHI